LIDGWLIRASLYGLVDFWLVKGYVHPEDSVVAVPYRHRSLIVAYRLRFLPCIGREVPLVRRSEIVDYVDPTSAFRVRRRDLPESILELIDILNPEVVGLTGSWALLSERPRSDVDLIVYDKDPLRLYRALVELRDENKISQCRSWEEMRRKISSTWILTEYLRGRLLESCYRGSPYTLRILRRTEPLPCRGSLHPPGRAERLKVFIRSSEESFLVPARYPVTLLEGPAWLLSYVNEKNTRVSHETWRTRYQTLKEGIYIVENSLLVSGESEVIIAVDPQGRVEKTTSRSHASDSRGTRSPSPGSSQ